MNILIVVHDLITEKWHLMPWRTVVEVVHGLQRSGHNAILVSLADVDPDYCGDLDDEIFPPHTVVISKRKQWLGTKLSNLVSQHSIDVIFWPITWHEPRWRLKASTDTRARVIAWIPGGVYSVRDAIYALRSIGVRKSLPYLIDSIFPRRTLLAFMKHIGIESILSMTELTSRAAIQAGWPANNAFTIPPGKEMPPATVQPLPQSILGWVAGKPFLLFMGPPSAIRGIYEMLDAFEMASANNPNMKLVCLFRGDGVLDRERIANRISSMASADNIHTTWESLPRSELDAFIHACRAAVMPFVLVPSEIPLAIIETAACGKPVISTQCGGTGEYVASFGAVSAVGDVRAMADNMLRICCDEAYYQQRCAAARHVFEHHLDWGQVASGWFEIAKKTNKIKLI